MPNKSCRVSAYLRGDRVLHVRSKPCSGSPSRKEFYAILQTIVLMNDDAVYSVMREVVRQQTKIVHLHEVEMNRIMIS